MAAIDGTISVRVSSATSSRPSSLVAAIELMITGAALMLSAVTWGSTVSGRPALRQVVVDLGLDSSTSVPNENSDDEAHRVRRGRLERLEAGHAGQRTLDRLGDLLGDVLGAGARIRGDDRDDRELDVRQELLLQAAPGREAGDEQRPGQQDRDAAVGDGELGEAAHRDDPFCGTSAWAAALRSRG